MKKIIGVILMGFICASCVPSTPAARIESEPAKFAALTKKEQGLVQQGQITRGMSQEAVEIAWGRPSQRLDGFQNGKPVERWDYTGSRPVYFNNFYGSYGYGSGPYGRGRYSSIGYGVGPEVTYIPYPLASVWFANKHVESWERARSR